MPELKPVAYATFCEEWITDHTADPYRAEQWREDGFDVKELHIIHADQVMVPRELLEAALKRSPAGTAEEFYAREKAICELRALLQR